MAEKNTLHPESWLMAIVESSDDPIFSKTLDGIIMSWNNAASRLFGYYASEIIGRHISILIPETKLSEEKFIMDQIGRGMKVKHYATERMSKKGERLHVSLSVSPIHDEYSNVIGASVYVRDLLSEIEEDKRISILASIIQNTDDAIISKDLNGIITSWNPGAEKIFGYKETEAIGKPITLIIPDHLRSEEDYIIGMIKKGERIDHFETIRRHKNGSYIPLSITVSPIKDRAGKIIGASKIARALAEVKIAEEKKAILAAIVESSDDAIISKTLEGVITSWNPGAERILGYSEEEILGKNIKMLLPEEKLNEEDEILSKIRNGERIEHFETVRVRKDGVRIHVSITVSPIRSGKKIIGASKILRDIGERIETENQLHEQARKLIELNKSKDEFIGIASHELKTPMTSIKAYLQLIERSIDQKKEEKFSNYIHKTLTYLGKLEELVSDLLDVSKIQAGKLNMHVTDCVMNTVVKDAIESVQHTSPHHKIECEFPDKDIIVCADQNRIEQVVINFLTNAVKYSPGTTKILVELWTEGGYAFVKVKDFGIGISKEQQQLIFERFYRAEGIEPKFAGLGIGLFISKEIITRHNGRIYVESEPGAGSSFTFCIPLK